MHEDILGVLLIVIKIGNKYSIKIEQIFNKI